MTAHDKAKLTIRGYADELGAFATYTLMLIPVEHQLAWVERHKEHLDMVERLIDTMTEAAREDAMRPL